MEHYDKVMGYKIQRILNITPQQTSQVELVRRLGYFALEGKIEKPANYAIYQQFLTDFDIFCRAKQLFEYKLARPLTWGANWSSTSVPRPLGEGTHLWTPTSKSDDNTPRPPATSTQPPRSAPGPTVQRTVRSIAPPGDSKFDQVKKRVPAEIHPHEIISALQSTGGSVQEATEFVLRACEKRISRPKNSESNRVLSSTPGNAPPKKRPPSPMNGEALIERKLAKKKKKLSQRGDSSARNRLSKGEEPEQQGYARNEKTKSVPSQTVESEGDCVITEVRKL